MPGGEGGAAVEGPQVVFAWGAGEDGQLGLEEAPSHEEEWHVSAPTVRVVRVALRRHSTACVCSSAP
jgi:hypothetical protein